MFRVTRHGPERGFSKVYGPVADEARAHEIARAAAEKHPGATVIVEPLRAPAREPAAPPARRS